VSAERRKVFVLIALLAVAVAYSIWPTDAPTQIPAGDVDARASRGASPAINLNNLPEPPSGAGVEHTAKEGEVGRNIFRFYTPPTRVPTAVPPPPTPVPGQGDSRFIGPSLPTPTPTATPIIPPAIPYTAIGIFGTKDHPIVAFEDSGRIINAREGDTLDQRFILLKVNRESVDFGFVGLPKEITRRLPITGSAAAR
jgi:hypothetical protein